VKRFLSKRWVRRLSIALAVAYALSVVVAYLVFRFVGENWWISAIGMYLPRIAFAAPLVVFVPLLSLLRERRWLWSQAVALVIVVFPLMGLVLPGPGPSSATGGFRVMSFNVASSVMGREPVFRAIAEQNPDILLVQESTDWSKLHELVHERYPHVEWSTQFLVASRWPIVSTTNPSRIPYGDRQRSPRYLRHVLRTPSGLVTFYNVHPLSPRESFYELRGDSGFRNQLRSGQLFAGGAKETIEANAGLRALQIRAFARSARAETGPVVIAGDFNQTEPSPLFAGDLADFRDAFREGSSGFGYTFPSDAFKGRRTPKIPWMRLDRILIRGDLEVTDFRVACRNVSDHRCVVADLVPSR
jgi:endonuclease/exonuclease/phosphatase family metal-dependent hydrolase